MLTRLLAVLALVTLAGCSLVQQLIGQTTPYTVTVCYAIANQGTAPVCGTETQNLPAGLTPLLTLAARLAEPYLMKSGKFDVCAFETYSKATEGGAIVVTGTASCTLKGQAVPVDVAVTTTIAPAPPPA